MLPFFYILIACTFSHIIDINQKLSLWKIIFDVIDLDSNGNIHSTEYSNILQTQMKDTDDITTKQQDKTFIKIINEWLLKSPTKHATPFDPDQNMNFTSFINYFFQNEILKYKTDEINNNIQQYIADDDDFTNNLGDIIFSSIPEQIHLSLALNITNSMMVMWITNIETIASVVYYSNNLNNIMNDQIRIGNSTTYTQGMFNGWKGRIHYALMTHLIPNTNYYYIVGDENQNLSDIQTFHSFRSNPHIANNDSGINGYNFAIFGDMGSIQFMGWTVNEQLMQDEFVYNVNTSRANYGPYDLIIHVGDITYAGTGSTREYEYFWDLWMRMVEPLSAHIPWMVSVGNHEHYYNWSSWRHRFIMPGSDHNTFNGDGLFWYSYDYGFIHFISMCTEVMYTPICDYSAPSSKQYKWLINDLRNINRTKIKWVIILGHRPMYSSDKATDSGPLQKYIDPLLSDFKVDLAIWGHMHCVERTYPVHNFTKIGDFEDIHYMNNPNATIHLTVGTAGAVISEEFVQPKPDWSVYRNGTVLDNPYGYGMLRIFNETHLYYQFAKQDTREILDYMWLVKT